MSKWIQKYEILLSETLNTEQMKVILERQHGFVRKLRIEMLAHFKEEGIKLHNNKRIPTELFLKYIGKDLKYYEKKMIQESKLNKYKKEII